MRRAILIVSLIAILVMVVACSSDEPQEAEIDNVVITERFLQNTQIVVSTQQAETQAAIRAGTIIVPTPTPTINPGRIVTFTPIPTIVVEDEDDQLGNTYRDQSWQEFPFTTADGFDLRIADFENAILLVHVFNTSCTNCDYLQRQIIAAAEDLAAVAMDEDFILIGLNVNTEITPTSLVYVMDERDLGPNGDINWLMGTASEDLVVALQETFGEETVDPDNLPLIFVDLDGNAHIHTGRAMLRNDIRGTMLDYTPSEEEIIITQVVTEMPAEE